MGLARAKKILDDVKMGRVEVQRAKKMLVGLDDSDRKSLARDALIRSATKGEHVRDELQALNWTTMGKQPGHTTSDKYKGAGLGFGSHMSKDIESTIAGTLPGLYLTGRSIARDVAHVAQGEAPTETYKQVLKPMGKSYAHTYGPLVKGDVGEFSHRVFEHPLGPMLDVAALASAGIGGAARTADALAAVRAGRAVEEVGSGITRVGARTVVQQQKDGKWMVRRGNEWLTTNLPDKASAVKSAQQFSTNEALGAAHRLSGSPATLARKGFMAKGARGGLLDLYERKTGVDYTRENQHIANEFAEVYDDPNLRTDRRSPKEVGKDIWAGVKLQAKEDVAKPGDISRKQLGFMRPGGLAAGVTATAGIALREFMDGIRIGAIYMRPAYLPNNWAGNTFMNMAHQGFFAPVNLAKSAYVDKALGKRYGMAMDKAMGTTPGQAVLQAGKQGGKGYIGAVAEPGMEVMGKIADVPFRRAAFLHEARKQGYRKLSQVNELFDRAGSADAAVRNQARNEIADIARRGQEEIVKFGKMNPEERAVVRNLFFVYSWMKGAGRYGMRFPLQHPIQTAGMQAVSQPGNKWVETQMGGVPNFLVGAIPVGRTKDGNPIMINPFALNPLGTGLDELRAAQGTAKVLGPILRSTVEGKPQIDKPFNKFAETDILSLAHPLFQAYMGTREGTPPNLQNQIAPLRLIKELQHPGSGSVYPTSRMEAVGHFVAGTLYPREASQEAITKSLERQHEGDPLALLPQQIKFYENKMGTKLPTKFVSAIKGDMEMSQVQKKFQREYAHDHGQTGFRNLPPKNKLEAALEFAAQFAYMDPKRVDEVKATLDNAPDLAVNDVANAYWRMTGIGRLRRKWTDMLAIAHGLESTEARP